MDATQTPSTARHATTPAVSLSRFVASRHANDCHFCGGVGRVLAVHQSGDEDGIPDTDLCPQCRGSKLLEWCDACLAMTASAYQPAYELGDECRATRAIAIQAGRYTVRRLACADNDCLTRVVESARREAQGIAERAGACAKCGLARNHEQHFAPWYSTRHPFEAAKSAPAVAP